MPELIINEPLNGGVYSKQVPIDILVTDDYAVYEITISGDNSEENLYLSNYDNLLSEVAIKTSIPFVSVGENQYININVRDLGGNGLSYPRKITIVD